ncbi:hypothetical protein E5D57_006033 [Metarhizium anisopliae]|nr:hypothetical protein E5D57_006033 [Metarhizium anisopliae]
MEPSENLHLKIQKTTSPTVYWQISGLKTAKKKDGIAHVIPEQQSNHEIASFTMRYPGANSKIKPSGRSRGRKSPRCIFRSSTRKAGGRRPECNILDMTRKTTGHYSWEMDFRLSKDKSGPLGCLVKALRCIRSKRDTGTEYFYWLRAKSDPDEWKLLPAECIGKIFGGYRFYEKHIGAEFRDCTMTVDGDLGKDKDFVRRACLTLVAALWIEEQSSDSTETETETGTE